MMRTLPVLAASRFLLVSTAVSQAQTARELWEKGLEYGEQQRCTDAIAQFRLALKRSPTYSLAQQSLTICVDVQKDKLPSGAAAELFAGLSHFARATRAQEQTAGKPAASAGTMMSMFAVLDNFAKATDRIQTAISMKHDYAPAHRFLAAVYIGKNDLRTALPHFEKAVELDPLSGEAQNDLAVAYYRLDRYEDAIRHVDEAVRLRYRVDRAFLEALKPHRSSTSPLAEPPLPSASRGSPQATAVCDLSQFKLVIDKAEVETKGMISGYLGTEAKPGKGDRLVIVTISGTIPTPCEITMSPDFFVGSWSSVTRRSVGTRTGFDNRYESWNIQSSDSSGLRLSSGPISFKVPRSINLQAAFSVPAGITTIGLRYTDRSGREVSLGKAAVLARPK